MIKKLLIIIPLCIVLIVLIMVYNSEPFHFTGNLFFGKKSNVLYFSDSYTNVDSIDINVDNGFINFYGVDSDSINVEIFSNRDNISIKNYNKRLSIITENYKKCFFCKMNVINLYVPYSFKEYINVYNGYGHTVLDNFSDSSIYAVNRFGNFSSSGSKYLDAKVSRGIVNISDSNILSLNLNWGNAFINNVNSFNYEGFISDVNVMGINNVLNLKNDFGNILLNDINIVEKSFVSNNVGDVKVEGVSDSSLLDINKKS